MVTTNPANMSTPELRVQLRGLRRRLEADARALQRIERELVARGESVIEATAHRVF